MFNRIILSRKGFDSASGGGFSPFDPQTGRYILLPIPDGKIDQYIGNPKKFEEIVIKQNYLPGIDATNLKELINSNVLRLGNKVKENITKNYAHFDPWLGVCPWLAENSNHQLGVFGQEGNAQAQLNNKEVGKGSLFLFFSRFKPIKLGDNNCEKMIITDIIPEQLNRGLYFIYGWLKVKEVIHHYKDIVDTNIKLSHPHATEKYFEEHKCNTLFIADELLFEDDTIPGCGYFPELNEHLLLTALNQKSQKNWIPSRWGLPVLLYDKCLSVLTNRKCGDGSSADSCLVNTQGQWQEAIFEGTDHFDKWFRNLLNKSNVKRL